MSATHDYEVAIVGGGSAGLSAAVALARSQRAVVVVDAGEPRNAPAAGAHNLLGREGVNPMELLELGRREATQYGAEVRHSRATAAHRTATGFELDLADNTSLTARRLLLATGLVDELPDVPGVREFWGRSVLHCPYCHGWEVRGKRIAILGTGPAAMHQTLLFRQLSENVTLFEHRMPKPTAEERSQLAALGVRVVPGVVASIRSSSGVLTGVALDDGTEFAADAVVVAPRFSARAELYLQLGGKLTEHPNGAFIATEPPGRTQLEGVWAAGNVTDLSAMVTMASAAGLAAGAGINAELVLEDATTAQALHHANEA